LDALPGLLLCIPTRTRRISFSSATGTSQQTFATTYSLPANLLVAGRVIEIDYWFGWVGQSSTTQQFVLYLGGTSGAAIFTGAAVQPAPVGSGRNSMVRCLIQGDGSPGTGVTVLGSCMGGAGYSSTEASPFGSIGQSTPFPVANTNTSLAITATMTFGSQPSTAATANIYGMVVIQWN
jgi:hypothetical protein